MNIYQEETAYYTPEEVDLRRSEIPRLLEFRRDCLRKTSWLYVLWLMFGILISFGVYHVSRSEPLSSLIPSLSVYYIFVLIHIIFRFKKGGRANVLAPDVLYIAIYTVFHLGYVTLYALDFVPYSTYIFYYVHSIPRSLLVVNLGLLGFLFGYEIIGPKSEVVIDQSSIMIPRITWAGVGVIFMAVALAMHYFAIAAVGMALIRGYGYTVLQNISMYTSYFWALMFTQSSLLMSFGLVIYVLSSTLRHGKLFYSKPVMAMFIVFISTVALEGNRTEVLLLGVPVMLIRHYFIKRIRIRYLAGIAVGALMLFAALGVARTIALNPAKMWQEYKYKKSAESMDWTTPIVEMGGSFLVVSITCGDVPYNVPYWKGSSWRDSIIHFVPFLQRILAKAGLPMRSPSDWVTVTYFGLSASGRGFTVAAEGYLNFGLPGAFAELMLFGVFIRWLTIKFSKKPSAMWGLIFLGCMGPSVIVIRNHMNLVTNVITQVFLIAILFNILLGHEPYSEGQDELTYNSDYA
ncbi:MAG: oligosaccharide repeat unit polymerase [Sedimentisphaerales bacterium]|nr:oligosaccharide repeat unit polymerase [Sedimentisphaerales bacterium]